MSSQSSARRKFARVFGTLWAVLAGCILPLDSRAAETSQDQLAKECAAFATMFSDFVPKGRLSTAEAFDVETLVGRTKKLLQGTGVATEALPNATRTALDKALAALQGTQLQFLRVRQDNGETRALLRVIGRENTLNYLELVCELRLMKQVKIVDLYSMTSGELLSETMQRIAIMVGPEPSLFDRLAGRQNAGLAKGKAALEIVKLSEAGDHQGVLKKFNVLSPELQRQKLLIMLRAKSASKVSEPEYLGALRFWRANYPKDPAVDLISIDSFFLQQKYDMALEAIDRLDASVGGDPYLDLYRSTLHQKMGQNDLAETEKRQYLAYVQNIAKEKQSRRGEIPAVLGAQQPPGLVPPSVRQAARTTAAQTAPAKPGAMRLQGVFMRVDNPTAIISGHTVAIGDSVEGNKVVKIEASRVVLQNPQGELIQLAYQ